MKTEYQINMEVRFETSAERDKVYEALKNYINGDFRAAGIIKGCTMGRTEYQIPDGTLSKETVI